MYRTDTTTRKKDNEHNKQNKQHNQYNTKQTTKHATQNKQNKQNTKCKSNTHIINATQHYRHNANTAEQSAQTKQNKSNTTSKTTTQTIKHYNTKPNQTNKHANKFTYASELCQTNNYVLPNAIPQFRKANFLQPPYQAQLGLIG